MAAMSLLRKTSQRRELSCRAQGLVTLVAAFTALVLASCGAPSARRRRSTRWGLRIASGRSTSRPHSRRANRLPTCLLAPAFHALRWPVGGGVLCCHRRNSIGIGEFAPIAGGAPGAMFEKAGIDTSNHFLQRLAQREASGRLTEAEALDAYRNGGLYYDEKYGTYSRGRAWRCLPTHQAAAR